MRISATGVRYEKNRALELPPPLHTLISMPLKDRVGKMLLALAIACSMAWMPPAIAVENPVEPCCCQSLDTCDEPAARSSCACPACPVQFSAQPLIAKHHSISAPRIPSLARRWNPLDESAAERRIAPPVPPPRATA